VKDTSILDVHSIAYADGVHVATEDGIEPDATIPADGDITYDGGIFGQVGILADFWGKTSD
jgi:hypothetical protein